MLHNALRALWLGDLWGGSPPGWPPLAVADDWKEQRASRRSLTLAASMPTEDVPLRARARHAYRLLDLL